MARPRGTASPIIIVVIIIVVLLLLGLAIWFFASGGFKQAQIICKPPPTGIQVKLTNGKPVVSWNAVTGATSYNVYVSKSDGTPVLKVTTNTNTTSVTLDLVAGGNYIVQVSSNGSNCEGPKSDKISFVIPSCPQPLINAPTDLRFEGSTAPGSVTLIWSPVSGAASYTVFRKNGKSCCSTSDFDESQTTSDTTITFNNLMPGKEQSFTIVSNNSCGDSGSSCKCLKVDVCCAHPPPVTITQITSTSDSVTITWNLNGLTEKYLVYIKCGDEVSPSNYDDVREVCDDVNTFTYTGLKCDTLYAIGVAGRNCCDDGVLNFGIIKTGEKTWHNRKGHLNTTTTVPQKPKPQQGTTTPGSVPALTPGGKPMNPVVNPFRNGAGAVRPAIVK